DECVAAAVAAVDGNHHMVGQIDAGVHLRNRSVVPHPDGARIDAGQHGATEPDVALVQAGQVVVDHLARNGQWNIQHVWVHLHDAVRKISVGGADLRDARKRLRYAGAAARRLGGNAHLGVSVVVGGRPCVEQGVQQAGSRFENVNFFGGEGFTDVY